jgi:two-component system sensor histidine kinase KdpD
MFSMAFSPPPPLTPTPPSAEAPNGLAHPERQRHTWSEFGLWLRPYLWSTAGVVLATLVGIGLTDLAPVPNVSMLYLLAVVFSAARFGIWPALLASGLSFLAYNFFFSEPRYTFSVTEPHELLSLLTFLIVALLISAIAGQAKLQANKAAGRAQAAQRLYEFAKRLSGTSDPQAVLDATVIQVYRDLSRATVILLAEGDLLTVKAACPPEYEIDPDTLSVAHHAYSNTALTSAGPRRPSTVPWLFLPLRTPERTLGLIGVAHTLAEGPLEPEIITFLQTVAELTSTAFERARLGQEISTARTAAETERMRNILLSSISHDFRTPLASVLGAATSLIDYGAKLPETARRDLLVQVKDEAEHLDGMVRNLLALTRVEAHALEMHKDWVDVRELFDHTAAVARRRGATQTFEVNVEKELPFVPADPTLLDQVVGNLVGNATRYAGPKARVTLEAKRSGGDVLLSVTDDGPGIPSTILPHVFDRFVRGPTLGDGGQSTGLGLAIAKGIVEAHQGTIWAGSPVEGGRGTRITVRLPLAEKLR